VRTPPQSQEAEQSLLGCLLQDNAAMQLVADLVDEHSFYFWQNKLAWSAIERLLKAGKPADPVTVHEELRRTAAPRWPPG